MPWDVFNQGLARRVGLTIGFWVIAFGLLILLAWIPLRQRPGLGTVSNIVVIGFLIDLALRRAPAPAPDRRPRRRTWSPGSCSTASPPRSTSAPGWARVRGTG